MADVTVQGVVAAVSASARVISLAQPVSGVVSVALTADTKIVRPDGSAAALSDVRPGGSVEATGPPGAAQTVVARRLVVLP